jgi:hypothetical protein
MQKSSVEKKKKTKITTKVTTKPVVKKNVSVKLFEQSQGQLAPDMLLSFISAVQTNIGKSTFYNMAEEQQQSLASMHEPIFNAVRPFYTLMMLPQGTNDVNKQLIAWTLIEHSEKAVDMYKDSKGITHQYSQQTMWENELILQIFENMPVTRVFDFFSMLQEKRVTKKRAIFLIHEYLRKNKKNWPLWAIKYRKDFKRILRHSHINYSRFENEDKEMLTFIWRYLKYNEYDKCPELIKDYVDVQNGDQSKLVKLPVTVAEGFTKKFSLTSEQFLNLFSNEGGQFTAKEKRTKDLSVKAAGASTGFDIRKTDLMDSLIYLHSAVMNKTELPMSVTKLKQLLDEKATAIAKHLSFTLDNVAVILDTSKSMIGTDDQKFHPLLRGMAISAILKHVSNGFKEYKTSESDDKYLFPLLKDQSNYSDALIKALQDGCTTIVMIGDGYENAPFAGAVHQILFTYKSKIDTKNKLMVLHFNPVFAAEAKDVRSISNIASSVGIRSISSLNEVMFLAIAKQRPLLAATKYLNHLLTLQSDKALRLMPQAVKSLLSGNNILESK